MWLSVSAKRKTAQCLEKKQFDWKQLKKVMGLTQKRKKRNLTQTVKKRVRTLQIGQCSLLRRRRVRCRSEEG